MKITRPAFETAQPLRLAASARERAEATEERERARKRAGRAAELASFRRTRPARKTLRRSTEKAESKRARGDAKDAERRAGAAARAEKLAADAESRARTAMARESAAAAATKPRKKSAKRSSRTGTPKALAQMTGLPRRRARRRRRPGVAGRAKEGASAAEPTDRADAAAAESAARCSAAASEPFWWPAPRARTRWTRTPTRATTSGDDFGAARSLVSAARRATVDAGLRGGTGVAPLGARGRDGGGAARRARDGQASRELHDAEADAHAAWAALDVERARDHLEGCFRIRGRRRSAPAVDAMTPASSASRRARSISCRWCLRRSRSPGHEAMETERAALVGVAHLNARRARPERRFAALEHFGGAAGRADEATARGSRSSVSSFGNSSRRRRRRRDALRPRNAEIFLPRPHPTSSRSTWTSGSARPGGGDGSTTAGAIPSRHRRRRCRGGNRARRRRRIRRR